MPDVSHSTDYVAFGQDAQKVSLLLVDSSGNLVASVTSPTITLSKNGAAFAGPSDGTFAEVSSGLYTVTLNTEDTDTEGWLTLRLTHASTADILVHVLVGSSPAQWHGDHVRMRTLHRRLS